MLCRAGSCGSVKPTHYGFNKGASASFSWDPRECRARKLEAELTAEAAKLQIPWFHVLFCLPPPLRHKIRTKQLC